MIYYTTYTIQFHLISIYLYGYFPSGENIWPFPDTDRDLHVINSKATENFNATLCAPVLPNGSCHRTVEVVRFKGF